MKPYTVIWEDPAIDDVAALWNFAANRVAITKASHQIDALLRATGEQAGVIVSPEGLRGLTVLPLRVIFVASADDRMVRVMRARLVS